jgi:acetyl-CoA acetyltransferase
MPVHDDHSQGTLESNTAGPAESSNSNATSINNLVSVCEKLVDDAVEKDLPAAELADSLKALGLKAIEALDYIDEFNQ